MYGNEPEYIVKLQSETIDKAIAIVDKIKKKHPNAKIRIEVEVESHSNCNLFSLDGDAS